MNKKYDFIIIGSTPSSALLAGVLASVHGFTVCWAGAFLHPLRPQRGFDISVAPLTRPETWQLLRESVPQTTKLLSAVSAQRIFERVDPLLITNKQAHADALAHMRNIAVGYGFQVERLAISERFLDGYQFRDAVRVQRRPLTAAIPQWLETCGVQTISPDGLKLKTKKNDATHIGYADGNFDAKHVILADSDAIRSHIGKRNIAKLFRRTPMSALLFEPTNIIASSIVHSIDRGLVIYQRGGGALDCVGAGSIQQVGQLARVHTSLNQPLQLVGRAQFEALQTKDGAAILGSLEANDPIFLAGMGQTGLFQVPAIARVLAGTGSPFEKQYFAARAPSSLGMRTNIAEFAPETILEPAI